MLRFAMEVGHCSPCANTASAALINGWISSILISGPRARGLSRSAILTHHVLNHLVQDLRFHRLLHEMTSAPLQRRHDVLLISDGGHHDNACFGVLLHNFLGSLDPFHLWHGDVHEDDIRLEPLVFADSGHAVSGFACDLATECFDHPGQIFAREDGIVHYQVADRLTVLTAFHWRKLFHITTSYRFKVPASCSCLPDKNQFLPTPAALPPSSDSALPPVFLSCMHWACKVLASASRATTRTAYPRSMAAFGMPYTTQDCSL